MEKWNIANISEMANRGVKRNLAVERNRENCLTRV